RILRMFRLSVRTSLLGSSLSFIAIGHAAAQQITRAQPLVLNPITLTTLDTRVEGSAIEALAGVSTVNGEELSRQQPASAAEILRRIPGVAATPSGDDSSVAVNIRGLQQMGRVVVTVDGARQDFWRVGHGSGSFY